MKTVLQLREFEQRIVPAVTIDSSYETYGWVLINTLRANPSAFANNLDGLRTGSLASAFGFAKTDPVISDLKAMITNASVPGHYAQALAFMRATANAGPFGWNELLENRAGTHSEWMKTNGFEHTEQNSGSRFAIPGFSVNNAAPADTWGYAGEFSSFGENIGYAVGSLTSTKAAYNSGSITLAGLQQRAAFLDSVGYMLELNSSSLGHLENLLGRDKGTDANLPSYNAIGFDLDLYEAPAAYEVQDGVAESYLSTQRFGLYRPGGSGGFIAGIAFEDRNSNSYYDVGEGLSLTVDVRNSTGGGFTDTLTSSQQGAFAGFVANGTYTVTMSINGTVISSQTATVNDGNAWIPFQSNGLTRPTLTTPIGVQANLKPTISWSGVENATGYQIRIDDRSSGATNIFASATTTATNWIPTADLVSGRNYRVWVRATLGTNGGPWSLPADFSIAVSARTGPTGKVADLRPNFEWSAVAGAKYQIRIDDLSAGLTNLFPAAASNTNSWEPSADLISGRVYRWQVRAVNDAGRGGWSAGGNFSIARPTLTGPATGVANLRPAFAWSAITGATRYEILVNDLTLNRTNIFPATQSPDPTWTPAVDLVSGRVYSWQVRAVNANGRGGWSLPSIFAVGRPVLSGPTGDVSDRTPPMSWSAINGAASYMVQVYDLTTSQRVNMETVNGTEWTPATDLLAGHRYRWWVRALNSFGQGIGSKTADFRVL